MEYDNTYNQQYGGEQSAVAQCEPAEVALPKECVFEPFHKGRQWVGHDHHPQFAALLQGADGIDDRGGVHEQLHPEGEQEGEVAVLGGHAGEDDAGAQPHSGHDEHIHGQQQERPVGGDGRTIGKEIVGIHGQEEGQLDAELDESAHHLAHGHDEAWEIDLPKDVGILGKCLGGCVERLGEVVPDDDTGQVEQDHGHPIGGDLGDVAKHHDVDGGGEDGLHHKPDGTQHSLLVHGDHIAFDEHLEQVAVVPYLLEVDVEGMPLGAYLKIELFLHVYF